MKAKTIFSFIAITFGLTWGLAASIMLLSDYLPAFLSELNMGNPLFIIAVYSPGIAGFYLVWRTYGVKGVGSFLKRITLWRASIWWWVLVIAAIPAIMYAGAAIKGPIENPFPFFPWYKVFPALGLALLLGPVEEFGWRGLALPLLQRKFTPFWAGLILGSIWMFWHLPAFVLGGSVQSGWSFAPFFAGGVASSLIFTAMFNDTRGSLLFAVLLHYQMNNPIWPDAQPWDNFLLAIIAIAVVWFKRDKLFQRDGAITDIL
jgi:uncharacterized protein